MALLKPGKDDIVIPDNYRLRLFKEVMDSDKMDLEKELIKVFPKYCDEGLNSKACYLYVTWKENKLSSLVLKKESLEYFKDFQSNENVVDNLDTIAKIKVTISTYSKKVIEEVQDSSDAGRLSFYFSKKCSS